MGTDPEVGTGPPGPHVCGPLVGRVLFARRSDDRELALDRLERRAEAHLCARLTDLLGKAGAIHEDPKRPSHAPEDLDASSLKDRLQQAEHELEQAGEDDSERRRVAERDKRRLEQFLSIAESS